MKRFQTALWAGIFMALSPQAQAAECAIGDIWSSEEDGLRTIVYYPEKATMAGRMTFEGWKGDEIQWRIVGEYGCSNGVVFCGISLPLSNGETLETSINGISEDDRTLYLVFSDLRQLSFRLQSYELSPPTLEAEWFVPEPQDDPGVAIILPTHYKWEACQTGKEMEAGAE